MKFLIVGASGLVGSNCMVYTKSLGHEVVGTHFSFPTKDTIYFNSTNLTDEANEDVMKLRPDAIIHCGALTNVDFCEINPQQSYNQTVQSATNVSEFAKRWGSKLIYISTDYVFDGVSGPYTEDATPRPINVYGKHKLEAENIVRKNSDNNIIVRVTNVYGDEIRNKNFIARIINNIYEGKEMNLLLPFDQFATPINALDIAKGIILLLENECKGLYHFGSTDFYSRSQLFYRVIKHFPECKTFNVRLTSTKELNQSAKRPLFGGLISRKLSFEYPHFQFSNVDDYLTTIIKSTKSEF